MQRRQQRCCFSLSLGAQAVGTLQRSMSSRLTGGRHAGGQLLTQEQAAADMPSAFAELMQATDGTFVTQQARCAHPACFCQLSPGQRICAQHAICSRTSAAVWGS